MSDFSIPSEWVLTEIGELGTIYTGKTPSTKDRDNFNGGIPFVKPADLDKGGFIYETADYLSEKGLSQLPSLPKNSIMVTCIGNLGKVGIANQICATNQQINSIIPSELIDYKYLYYHTLTLNNWLKINSSATTVAIINKSKFSKAPIKLPPKAEQEKIAELLDSYLMQVENIKARLNAIIPILKKFRQSILADAVSGRLIGLDEEFNQIEPSKLENLILKSGNGIAKRSGIEGNDITVLRLADFKDAQRINGNERQITLTEKEINQYQLNQNDILVIRVNGSVDLAGKFILYHQNSDIEAYCDHFIRFQLDTNKILPKFLIYIANFGNGRNYLKNSLSTSAGQNTINQTSIKNLILKVPTTNQQKKIVERVEQLFSYADNIETQINNALQRVNHLTQSILHQAFTGQLTADWRAKHPELITGDNSAEILLAKIQTAKEANQKPKSTKNQAKKEKTKMVSKLKKKSNFIYANTPLEEIPLYFRGYVKAHRHFESVVAKYEPKIAEFEDVKLFQEWIGWIRSDIKEVEKMIDQVEAEEMDFGTFKDYRYDLANGQFQGSLDGFYNSDESEIAEQAFDEIRKAGYIVYDYWIDSRQATDKLD